MYYNLQSARRSPSIGVVQPSLSSEMLIQKLADDAGVSVKQAQSRYRAAMAHVANYFAPPPAYPSLARRFNDGFFQHAAFIRKALLARAQPLYLPVQDLLNLTEMVVETGFYPYRLDEVRHEEEGEGDFTIFSAIEDAISRYGLLRTRGHCPVCGLSGDIWSKRHKNCVHFLLASNSCKCSRCKEEMATNTRGWLPFCTGCALREDLIDSMYD